MKKFIIFFIFSFYLLYAEELSIIKGKALVLSFDSINLKEIRLNDKKQNFFPHPTKPNEVLFILTSPYKKPLKKAKLKIIYTDKILNYDIKGLEGDYPKENLQVAKNKISPPKEVLQRIKTELDEANAVYARYTKEKLFFEEFIQPLNSVITSAFGNARLFNGTLSSYHGGTDFRASTGTPILAANDGIVSLAKDRYYAGKSIIIDHGYKIFTQYYHLSKLEVKPGDKVKKGQVIGLSGASGRVTGAHLHFGFFVNGTQVDPLDFITQINALLKAQ
ncbi:M23 family peptidase [Campylobacter sp. MIT 99-7217]|uniref:M23 family metallopeptidase n=1 Tax=Campylobacter sp. MIT 99-7217 TaxID=535091 RepID=UPI00115B818A|nr:M23 family metallopeptidase [Campylobacter sp. MIT 99-7217]TQR32980.1 M23 family peptidase [Campylobacter sp. MIT 99-7217]